ncbi:hypothetical protein AVEN_17797-1, partial [Araneus ventricosus]
MKLEISRVGEEEGWVEFCNFKPCLRTKFGASVNEVPHFSTGMDEKNPVLGQMEWNGVQTNAQLNTSYPM